MSTSSAQVPIERTEVSTRDRDEANELIEQMYVGHHPRTAANRAGTELTALSATAGGLAADRVRMSIGLDTDTDAIGTLLSFQLLSGTMLVDNGAEEVRLSRGGTVMYRPDVPLRAQADGFELAMLRVPVQRAAATAEQQTGIDAADLRFESMRPVSEAMDRYFSSVINMVHRDLMQPESAMSNPLVHEQMIQTAATAVLATFPNTTMTADHLPGPGHVAPAALRRAMAYIDAHAEQPLTLGDIATAAGVTARALQHAFRQHRETTPMGYLQQVRLARAHSELMAADPSNGETVATIAARWGFAKPGRFATAYRRTYGHNPSHTLRT